MTIEADAFWFSIPAIEADTFLFSFQASNSSNVAAEAASASSLFWGSARFSVKDKRLSGGVHNENCGYPTPTCLSSSSILTSCVDELVLLSRYWHFFFNLIHNNWGRIQKMTARMKYKNQNGVFITRIIFSTTGSFRNIVNRVVQTRTPTIITPKPTWSPTWESAIWIRL